MNLVEKSYLAHTKNWESRSHEVEERLQHLVNKNCAYYQVIQRTLDVLNPFLSDQHRWLTVGDYNGVEANYLYSKNQEVTASDITDTFLKATYQLGLIQNYAKVNVENIPFDQNSFDYVFCKEAYHHFPKAYLALHEMIRVSKKATIMIEPIDILQKVPLILFVKNVLDRFNPYLINKIWKNRFSFETVGNYVFKVSEREIEKTAMGMGFPCIAFKGINMLQNLQYDITVLRESPANKKVLKNILKRLKMKDLLSKVHLLPYNHLCCVIFKEAPTSQLKSTLLEEGYQVIDLPSNPYLMN